MNLTEQEIREVFSKRPEILYGFTGISWSSYASDYASALVFAVPYGEQLSAETYTEPRFEAGIQSARDVLEIVLEEIEAILQRQQVKYWIPPVAQENEMELRALFSFKSAAAHAGIGWYGKNDVIITERYGPRVRLSGDHRLPEMQPDEECLHSKTWQEKRLRPVPGRLSIRAKPGIITSCADRAYCIRIRSKTSFRSSSAPVNSGQALI